MFSRSFSWQFVSNALPDTWGMLRAVAALLGERDRGKDSQWADRSAQA
jgi:hypothetical protein